MTPPARPDTERVWLQCMIGALGGLSSHEVESELPNWRAINARQAAHAADLADAAVKEWRERYPDEQRRA